ncbi:pseudouridine-5'-phosphate glycosidase [Syntrophothermus lipocalidus]|nr:pseudouridine-5'-phosphate glycosidase [Syntrophothermus lipocalidus]HOV42535.1 pseudouridine-5'-phosphate glycosidase [Syntrophothermus lipocalidus]
MVENRAAQNPGIPIVIETALLGCGLPSIPNEVIEQELARHQGLILVWVEQGRVVCGGVEQFLHHRPADGWKRLDGRRVKDALDKKNSGYLTVSGVMSLFTSSPVIVVTAGMGGIREGMVSQDLICLSRTEACLIATAPKDSVDLEGTLGYLRAQKVRTVGVGQALCDGFLFRCGPVSLDGSWDVGEPPARSWGSGWVIFNPLPAELRLKDDIVLAEALASAGRACANGEDFHPAFNRVLDEMTAGQASYLQLAALVRNVELALKIGGADPGEGRLFAVDEGTPETTARNDSECP